MRLTAKPTKYRGVTMRSRVEARWAIFFDTLGIAWKYEPQGYNLAGVLYLPDFFLPDIAQWVEIKGQEPLGAEQEKARRLAVFTRQPVYILAGSCWPGMFNALLWDSTGVVANVTDKVPLFAPYGYDKQLAAFNKARSTQFEAPKRPEALQLALFPRKGRK